METSMHSRSYIVHNLTFNLTLYGKMYKQFMFNFILLKLY